MLLIKGKMELPPDPTEDEVAQERHLKDILAKAHDYDGVSTFPKSGKEGNKGRFAYKRQHSSVSSSCRGRVMKVATVAKVAIISDDEEECNQQQSPLVC